MPSISLRTVYQTLNDLAEMGEIQALDLGTGSTRFDPNIDEHHHLVCERCGLVRDVALDTGVSTRAPTCSTASPCAPPRSCSAAAAAPAPPRPTTALNATAAPPDPPCKETDHG